MLTLRVIPPRLLCAGSPAPAPRDIAALYFEALWRHWRPADRLAALALGATAAARGAVARRPSRRYGWDVREHTLFAGLDDFDAHLGMAARKGLHRIVNPGAYPLALNPLKNKRLFAARCRAAGLPAPDTFDGPAERLAGWLMGQNAVIAKPNFASKGSGVVGFRRDGAAWVSGGVRLENAEVGQRLDRMLRSGGVLQRGLATHPALERVSPGALPTLRIMTAANETGAIEACDRMIRLSAGGPRPVDNFNAGNLVAGIDADGRIAGGWGRVGGRVVPVEVHPTTGAILTGLALPDLAAAEQLAIRAHDAFRNGFNIVGWDVGLTADGPVLIEGNWNPGTDIVQLVSGRGLGDSRLGALYRRHLADAPAAAWRAARPVQLEPRGRLS